MNHILYALAWLRGVRGAALESYRPHGMSMLRRWGSGYRKAMGRAVHAAGDRILRNYPLTLVLLWIIIVLAMAGSLISAASSQSPRAIFAPTSIPSGADFVATFDTAGCSNRTPVVTWTVPQGCRLITGQSQPTARFVCVGARGASIRLSATAAGGRPPAACDGLGSVSVVIAGGVSPIPCCPIDAGTGTVAGDPVLGVVPSIYYSPGVASTGRFGIRVGVSVCQECPAP